ncbi:MAG: LppX_LprAFG lipoprotein [Candidatus Dormiibacterota bacterium]
MLFRVGLAIVASVWLLACGSTVDAGQQLKDAAAAMKTIQTVQLDLKFGAGATVTASNVTVDLVSATGKVKLPTDSELVGRVKQGDTIIESRIVTIGNDTYYKPISFLPASKLSPEEAKQYPSAARLLNPDTGLPSVIDKGQGAKVTGTESIDGQDSNKVEATYTPDDLKAALAPFTPADKVQVTFWIGKDDHRVRKALITGHVFSANSDSTIEVHLHDFNAAVDISPPA